MNITILVSSFPPAPVGGAQLQAEAWARRLAAYHCVTVVTRRDPPDHPVRAERDGYSVVRTRTLSPHLERVRALVPQPLRGRGLGTPINLLDTWGFARAVDALQPKPDVLLCFTTNSAGAIGVEVSRLLGIPAVVWIRGESDYHLLDMPGHRAFAPKVWARAAGVLVQSRTMVADFLAELERVSPQTLPVVRAKLGVVENGLDLPQLGEYRDNGPVLSVGRLVPEKGMDVVIDSCARLGRPLVIAGRGPESPVLQAQAADLRADVRFTGFLDREALDELYRQSSVVVLASHSEGTPNVVLEAMAHARPVVATRVGGIPDLIEDGVNGLLMSVGDSDALTSALSRLAADPDMGRRLGSAARISVERFEWPRVLPKLEAVLERCR